MKTIESLVRKNILALKPYSSARDECTLEHGIFLDANESPYGAYNRYPDPYQKDLKQQLAKIKGVPTNSIFIGNGSDEIIDLIFRVFCEPALDEALTFAPTYGMYQVAADVNNVVLKNIALNSSFQIDFENLEQNFSGNTKIMFVCSPNNPTGNNIDRISQLLQTFKGIVVVDEAYIDFSNQSSCITLINDYPNLIVTQTLSKAWGLAAARIGIAYAHPYIIALLTKTKPPYNVSLLNQTAALEALKNVALFEERKATILQQRTLVIEALQQMDMIEKIYPTEANFVLVKTKDADYIYNHLIEKNIIVRNRNSVVPNCIRISIGSAEENEKLIEALFEINSTITSTHQK